ncbi:ABC transporter substrate-binding protein [Mucilaginibacter sp. CSA2-8R]|uniref:ABC transporter substrate-binding protein n=1 Tax=Mucilaginibacter sp. CSA2-8R TaxID=3141542 RepID=UPI00315DEF70
MTLAQSHRLPLSGSKRLWLLVLLAAIGACTPKVRRTGKTLPVKPPTIEPDKPVAPPPAAAEKPVVAKTSSIALLLPFGLDNIGSVKGYKSADLKKADIAVDYYQGFKLALDSLTAKGYNYKVQVYDTKDEPGYTHSLSVNPNIRNSNLIVGPVFPEGIKSFAGKPAVIKKPLVSPLAPASPADFANPNLITVIPPLDYHAYNAAKFIVSRVKPRKVFILRSGFTEDNKYIVPFKLSIDSISKKKIQVVYYTVSHGSFKSLLPQLNNKVENVFIVPSVNQSFLTVTLRSLDTLATHYPITTIGHPNWEKLTFLKPDILQHIKAHITLADRINYRAAGTVNFIRAYRKAYKKEPSAFAYKGFDEGYYFGEILAQHDDAFSRLDQHDYKALHNEFKFVKKAGQGWINTHVNVFRYSNFELKKVE